MGLGLDATQLIDSAAIAAGFRDAAAQGGDTLRDVAISLLKSGWDDGRACIQAALATAPLATKEAISAYTYITDQIVCLTADLAIHYLHPNPNPTTAEHISILAVGGYGRAEMAPFSDIDLLFLIPYKQTPWGESVIETILYLFWDLKLKIGHSVRTIDECLRQGRDDFTIRTALLEHRFLYGDQELETDLDFRLWAELFDRTGPEFLEAKLAERTTRHKRHGGSRYLLEPNVKESKGGLRDLQTLFWIAKYLYHAHSTSDLVDMGVFTLDELAVFQEAERFLWATRVHLHLYSGRAVEQLTFDAQVEIAGIMGFEDSAGQRGVERFMQTYFNHARHVGELTRIFLVTLEEKHVKRRPSLMSALRERIFRSDEDIPDGYQLRNDRLNLTDDQLLVRDPVNILRLIKTALDLDRKLHPEAMRAVRAHLYLIDDTLRADPTANQVFLDILLDKSDPIRGLRRMSELEILGQFLPEFGRITGMMQFNMYHHYTVDEHTMQCLTQLFEIEQGHLVEDLPIASDILERGVDRTVMYVATMLHDIGKGRPQDHSVIGAKIAASICPRLGLGAEDTDTIVWLVRHHLAMSDVAQKRDLADLQTIRDFAALVQNPIRLKLLTVLTVCDIRGVGPNVWNNWKAVLIRELYARTLEELTGETDRQTRPERIADARHDFAALFPDMSKTALRDETQRYADSFWLGLSTETQALFSRLVAECKNDKPAINISADPERDATRACFAMPDHPGLFSRLAGALALAGANVVDARTYTSTDGVATPVFWIQDDDGAPYEAARLTRLRKTITRALAGEVVARDEFRTKDRIKRRLRDFRVPTRISFDNKGSEAYTMLEVNTRDRPGLLYDVTRALTANHATISSAIIATYGEEAVDTFYIRDLIGAKITSEAKQEQLAERLKSAIEQGTERAKE